MAKAKKVKIPCGAEGSRFTQNQCNKMSLSGKAYASAISLNCDVTRASPLLAKKDEQGNYINPCAGSVIDAFRQKQTFGILVARDDSVSLQDLKNKLIDVNGIVFENNPDKLLQANQVVDKRFNELSPAPTPAPVGNAASVKKRYY